MSVTKEGISKHVSYDLQDNFGESDNKGEEGNSETITDKLPSFSTQSQRGLVCIQSIKEENKDYLIEEEVDTLYAMKEDIKQETESVDDINNWESNVKEQTGEYLTDDIEEEKLEIMDVMKDEAEFVGGVEYSEENKETTKYKIRINKKRRTNYTHFEKILFLSIVEKHKEIIENKCTKTISMGKKNLAWQQITNQYNRSAQSGKRNTRQLKILYENLKRDLRKNGAEQNQQEFRNQINLVIAEQKSTNAAKEILKTGGGTVVQCITPRSELPLRNLAKIAEQVEPLANGCDTAAEFLSEFPEVPVDISEVFPVESPSENADTIDTTAKPPDPPVKIPLTRAPKRKRKKNLTAENYRKLYFRQKYLNAVEQGKAQDIINNLTIRKLRLEIKKLK